MDNEDVEIGYKFDFEDGKVFQHDIKINEKTMEVHLSEDQKFPQWTELDCLQCENCPLKKEDHPHCPLAQSIAALSENFAEAISHTKCQVTVTTEERIFIKDTDMQTGLQSIMGLIMATSGCPHLNFLKPMARFHLPFAVVDETLIRSISFYLLKQFLKKQKGAEPDYELVELNKQYAEVGKVNQGIFARLKSIQKKDGGRNAITVLDCFVMMFSMEFESNLGGLSKYFEFE